MAFCQSSEFINTGNYMQEYTPQTGMVSCLPSGAVIDDNGNVNAASLKTHVEKLLRENAPAISPDDLSTATVRPVSQEIVPSPAEKYTDKSKKLRESINKEYCHYYVRYMWGVTKILNDATASGAVVSPQLKTNVQILNTKLNTIILVMKGVVNSRLNTLENYYGGEGDPKSVNYLNKSLDDARKKLAMHSEKLQQNDLSSDIQQSMIEYSLEKNSSSRNLLALYGFMNIVAVGLLFYLYTNTKA
jgi:hypothetical protein